MNKLLQFILFTTLLLGCNLGTAQQLDTAPSITQYPPVLLTGDLIFAGDDLQLAPEVTRHISAIYDLGQQLGNHDHVFSKVGDSITVSRNFLYPFGLGQYDLASFLYLEEIVNQFSQNNAHIGNSFINQSLAAHEGWSANAVLNPQNADVSLCRTGETPLFCEYRIVQPTIALIMFGTNDVGFRTAEQFTNDMREIIRLTEQNGIIPIISTIPNRPDVPRQVIIFNDVLQQMANEFQIPIIDLYALTINLPNHGLTTDNVHLSASPLGLTATATFTAPNMNYGYPVRNLATLQALHIVQQIIQN